MHIAHLVIRVRTAIARAWNNPEGQDLIEYALMASFLAVAVAAIFPMTIAPNICTVFSKVLSTMNRVP